MKTKESAPAHCLANLLDWVEALNCRRARTQYLQKLKYSEGYSAILASRPGAKTRAQPRLIRLMLLPSLSAAPHLQEVFPAERSISRATKYFPALQLSIRPSKQLSQRRACRLASPSMRRAHKKHLGARVSSHCFVTLVYLRYWATSVCTLYTGEPRQEYRARHGCRPFRASPFALKAYGLAVDFTMRSLDPVQCWKGSAARNEASGALKHSLKGSGAVTCRQNSTAGGESSACRHAEFWCLLYRVFTQYANADLCSFKPKQMLYPVSRRSQSRRLSAFII